MNYKKVMITFWGMLFMLILTLSSVKPVEAKEENQIESGKWYDLENSSLRWKFDTKTKTLTIIGEGEMPGRERLYRKTTLPWWKLKDVRHIVLGDGITTIGAHAFDFRGCNISSVVIPDSVTSIGDYAFYDATALKQVKLPKKLQYIGAYAFAECCVDHIELPESLIVIGSDAFVRCKFKKVVVPDSVVRLGNGVFAFCPRLTQVTLSKNLLEIPEQLFGDCTELKQIIIPDRVNEIGEMAFSYCSNLSYVHIPESVSSIGSDAFLGCGSLSEITLPDQLEVIPEQCFRGCTFKKIHLPSKLKIIEKSAFRETNLVSVVIPKGVTTLQGELFKGCKDLKSIQIESSCLTSLDPSVIDGIPEDTVLVFPKEKEKKYQFFFSGNQLSGEYEKTKWWFNPQNETIYFRVTGAMEREQGDDDLDMQYQWESRKEYAVRAVFGSEATSVGCHTLDGFTYLTQVRLANQIEKKEVSAFANSGIRTIVIPCNVTTIEDDILKDCPDLVRIIILSEKLSDISEKAWEGIGKNVQITAPFSKQQEYEIMFQQSGLDPEVEIIYR